MIKIYFCKNDIDRLEYERFYNPDPKVQRKCEALFLKSQNIPHKTICKLCRISNVTLAKYLKQYLDGGIKRLQLNLYKGKKNSLAEYAHTLEEYFCDHPPHSTAEAQMIIEKKTGIKRGLSQVRNFLKRIGFTYRKVSSILGKAITANKLAEQKQFLSNELEPRLNQAKKGEREVFLWMPPTSSTKHI